ncbi:hypothetical protein [Bradyrhizobium sp. F1.13.3]|uniref:hypothetical protein n=1 Tax=Bradyrhizobium sp. F1.13.3 TaxID=3156351 RepID=UPI00339A7E44
MRVRIEAQTKAAHALANKIPDHVIGLFVEPVLLEGEDPNGYWNMVSAMIDERPPETFLDWIELNDMATKLWEERVFRRTTNAIIRGGQRLAVQQFMSEILPGEHLTKRLKKADDTADHRASRYFSENKKERQEIRSQLATYGITEAELLARSAQNNSDAILMFEGMVSSRERSRRKIQNDIRRRRSPQEVQAQDQGDLNAGRHGPCQEVKTEANQDFDAHNHVDLRSCQELESTSTDGAGLHQANQRGSCQEVEAKQDRRLRHLGEPRSCQEAKVTMAVESEVQHHHGH